MTLTVNFVRSEEANDIENITPAATPTCRIASSSQEDLNKSLDNEAEFTSLPPMHMPELEEGEKEKERSKGPRARRRRHGKKMDRSKLRRDAIQHVNPLTGKNIAVCIRIGWIAHLLSSEYL